MIYGSPLELYYRLRRKTAFLRGNSDGVAKWSNTIQTQRVLPVLRKGFDESEPPMIHVEITTDCNYKCPFCAQARETRPSKYISRDVFDRLVAELKAMSYHSSVVLYVDNEPFMHPDLMYFCEKVSRDLPLADYSVQTNGSLVSREHIAFLNGLERPPLFLIDDYTPDKEITSRIRGWLAACPGSRLDKRTLFLDRSWGEKLSNFAGNARGTGAPSAWYGDMVCTWPFLSMFLDTDLKAFLCCFDYHHSTLMGDLNVQSIMDVWTSHKYRDLRSLMLETQRKTIPLCKGCDVEWSNLPVHCTCRQGGVSGTP